MGLFCYTVKTIHIGKSLLNTLNSTGNHPPPPSNDLQFYKSQHLAVRSFVCDSSI